MTAISFLYARPRREHLQEDPLRPLVVGRIGGIDFPGPVEGNPQGNKLLLKPLDILSGHVGGMDMVFDGKIFGRQTKRVPADGVQHVIPLHPAFAGDDVQRCVRPGMPHMQPLPGRIRELDERVEFLFVRILVRGVEYPRLLPIFSAIFFLWVHVRISQNPSYSKKLMSTGSPSCQRRSNIVKLPSIPG